MCLTATKLCPEIAGSRTGLVLLLSDGPLAAGVPEPGWHAARASDAPHRPRAGAALRPGMVGRFAALLLLCAVCMAAFSVSVAGAATEYEVKAAHLFHYAQLVEWPESAFAGADAPICIGVLGDDPFGGAIDQTVEGESVRRRKIIVKRAKQAEDLKGCQIVFVCKSEAARADQILATLGESSILTVSEIEGFARHGGAIGFYFDGNKIKFEINPDIAKRHGLKVSSQLLGVGKIVH